MKGKIVNSTLNGVRLTELSDNNEVIVYTEAYVQELKHQLAEKDKEIEELKDQAEIWHKLLFEKMETQIIGVTNEKLKELRHEICEKIRKKFLEKCKNSFCLNPTTVDYITLEISEVQQLLDQIERGEE